MAPERPYIPDAPRYQNDTERPIRAAAGRGPRSRRQVVVRGVRVNDLIGKRFRIGDVECLGVEICEPCLHLQGLTRPGIINDLVHRGGLRADFLPGGTISVGDQLLEDHLAERTG
jgi:MOSC domain-containing protein YiiM